MENPYINCKVNGDSDFIEWVGLIHKFVDWRRHELGKYKKITDRLRYEDWKDIKSQVVYSVWKDKAKFDKSKPLGPWLKTIALRRIQAVIARMILHENFLTWASIVEDKYVEHDYDEDNKLNLFESCLDVYEKPVYKLLIDGLSMKQIAKETKKSLARIYQVRIKIEKKFEIFKNTTYNGQT